jgi:hypothetical protein
VVNLIKNFTLFKGSVRFRATEKTLFMSPEVPFAFSRQSNSQIRIRKAYPEPPNGFGLDHHTAGKSREQMGKYMFFGILCAKKWDKPEM